MGRVGAEDSAAESAAESGSESAPVLPADSDSDAPAPAEHRNATSTRAEGDESSSESSDACGMKLQSPGKAFADVSSKELYFKQFAEGSFEHLRKGLREPPKPSEPVMEGKAVIYKDEAPTKEEVKEVPLPAPTAKRPIEEVSKDHRAKETIKDRTKIKRMKGQSGEDHIGRIWKPDEWMKMRQEYD